MELQEFLQRPYSRVIRRDEDGDFVARIPELPGCVAHGATEVEALRRLTELQQLWFEDARERGDVLPTPVTEEAVDELPSGKWLQRVPRYVHQQLTQWAARERVSLNQLVTSVLSVAVGAERERDSTKNALRQVLSELPWSRRPAHSFVFLYSGSERNLWGWHAHQHPVGEISDRNAVTVLNSIVGQLPGGNQEHEHVAFIGHLGVPGLPEEGASFWDWPGVYKRKHQSTGVLAGLERHR